MLSSLSLTLSPTEDGIMLQERCLSGTALHKELCTSSELAHMLHAYRKSTFQGRSMLWGQVIKFSTAVLSSLASLMLSVSGEHLIIGMASLEVFVGANVHVN